MKKLSKKAVEKTVNSIYSRIGNGVQVGIFDLGPILDAGTNALNAGLDPETAEARMQKRLDAVRCN